MVVDNSKYSKEIELADEGANDFESSGFDTSTASLSSSINEYIMENGRLYHAYFGTDKNLMPTDEKEQDRLDMHHEIMSGIMGGKIYMAPLEHPARILDIGTGTGIWAIDMADRFPDAEVIGTDLSRNVSQAVGNWPKVMSEMYRCTKPGGYCELAELGIDLFSDDNTIGPNFAEWVALLCEALKKMNRPQATAEALKQHLEEAGFVDVEVVTEKQPFGLWPKEKHMKTVGVMVMLNAEAGAEAYIWNGTVYYGSWNGG
ncbi:Similar to tRNA1(Val) (adenine(37)-N6)-methyltransferase; acc. no. Q87SB8 [Pyronema omphalodes CBS 100304]|uniref:Similar to tRNA1(Val) (Adenine(37)-N6)-methyltransferase acc. no. Q87SB8 n=1 Tax=Pyronema omphalodes (strain CBS 100304) TaxID=1076935 RepID=U4LNX7_PYROM|nr:Similar to tRNA1(Val) (adenine(37)-N6)-methyltransferase; acc. no. Q87SB8 [Pyronema omphalodes CBS 100304]